MQWAPKIPQKMTRDIDNDIYRRVQKNIKVISQWPLEFLTPLWPS